MTNKNFPFAQRVANSVSVQSIIRAVEILGRSRGGGSILMEWMPMGVNVSLGVPNGQDLDHQKFLELLEFSDELMRLSVELECAKKYERSKKEIELIILQIETIAKKMYPNLKTVNLPGDNE